MLLTDFPVAIIGASCRLPGGVGDLDGLWTLLKQGRDAVGSIPPERFQAARFAHPDRGAPGRSCTVAAGLLENITGFDAAFFGISRAEALWLDPQQRLALELAWEACELAGLPPSRLAGSRTAVFLGAASTDMGTSRVDDPCLAGQYTMTGISMSIISNRLSYFLDLRGPSMTIDTACSSSLVALHQACAALAAGEASLALAGGTNLLLSPFPFIGFSKAHMLSATGRCRVFDAAADGYVRAEGGGLVLLKPLDRALAEGDRILAVIRASGVNSDGRTGGLTLPSETAQAELLGSLYQGGNLSPSRLAYLEAHGTGTQAGDRAEAASIGQALGRARKRPLMIGSIKGNVGHLETASGMAGLLKALLVLRHGAVPGAVHLDTPNPAIDFQGLNLSLARTFVPLPRVAGGAPLVGVNSFGFGGTNAHVVLQRAPAPRRVRPRAATPAAAPPPLFLSARSEASLKVLAGRYADLLDAPGADVEAVTAAAALRRDHLEHRLVCTGGSATELAQRLRACAEATGEEPCGAADPELTCGQTVARNLRAAFVFSGNGSQWPGMGQRLLAADAVFAGAVRRVDALLAPLQGWSVEAELQKSEAASRLDATEVAQPLLFAVQVGLVESLRARGVVPHAVCGHSVGEVAAAWCCGALTLAQAVRVIHHRSRLQGATRGQGRMAAVNIDEARAQEIARASGGRLELAAVNAPGSVTLAGDAEALAALGRGLEREGFFFRLLDLDYPFHCAAMEPLRQPLTQALAGLRPRAARLPFVSTVTGVACPGEELDAAYWWDNIRRPVALQRAVETLLDDGVRLFLELGGHGVLQYYLKETARAREAQTGQLSAMRRNEDDAQSLDQAWRQAYVLGWPLDFPALFPRVAGEVVLPLYPWDREELCLEPTPEAASPASAPAEHPLLGWRLAEGLGVWTNTLDTKLQPWLADHRLGGSAVFPAAGFLELALAAGRLWGEGRERLEIENLSISRPLVLSGRRGRRVRVALGQDGVRLTIESRGLLAAGAWTRHAAASVRSLSLPEPAPMDLRNPEAFGQRVEAGELYALAGRLGLDYGPAFRTVAGAWAAKDSLLVRLAEPEGVGPGEGLLLPPTLVDGAFQSLFLLVQRLGKNSGQHAFLPAWFGRAALFRAGRPAFALARVRRVAARSIVAEFDLLDQAGNVLLRLLDCRFRQADWHRAAGHKVQSFAFGLEPRPHPDSRQPASPHPDWLPEPALLAQSLAPEAGRLSALLGRRAYHDEVQPLCGAFCLALAHETLHALAPSGVLAPAELAQQGLVSPEHAPYLVFLLELLETGGLARREGANWRVAADSGLPLAAELWRTVLSDHPAHLSETALLGQLCLRLPALLRGQPDKGGKPAAPALAPAFLDSYQLNARSLGYANALAAALVKELVERLPAGQRLRILDAGACPGGLARTVLPVLDPERCEYLLADRDAEALDRMRALWGGRAGVAFAELDLEQPGAAVCGDFQLILAGHALSEAGSLPRALAGCRALLAPGGLLAVLERPPSAPVDLVFGAQPRWWDCSAGPERPASRLMTPERWLSALAEAGFEGACLASEVSGVEAGGQDSFLILARRGSGAASAPSVVEVPEAAEAVSPRYLLLADAESSASAAALCAGLGERLSAAGCEPLLVRAGRNLNLDRAELCVDPLNPEHWRELLESLGPERPLELVHLLGFDTGSQPTPERQHALQTLRTASAGMLARAWGALRCPARLWLVCGGAQDAPGGQTVMSQGGLWGLGRVLMNELPGLGTRLIDLHGPHPDAASLDALALEIVRPTAETEVVLADGQRHCPRLAPFDPAAAARLDPELTGSIRLGFDTPGGMDHLRWRQMPRVLPGPGQVLVKVRATGLNFRDVLWVQGILPEEALENGFSGPTLGLECSGVVQAVGPGVDSVQPGDEVLCFAPACFASHVLTRADLTAPKPQGLSHEEACTIPVAFFTAYYALKHLAGLEAGDSVLVHGGAGGVGLAAIQLAAHLGLTVFATAGSPERREFLTLLGVPHVLDSRSLGFADEVLALTGGAGVDAVLNSLAGEAMSRGLAALKPFGRFLELGKRDFFAGTDLSLRPFRNNISYFGIDVDQLLNARPGLGQRLFTELMELFRQGALRPLPLQSFPRAGAADAFRSMQQGQHLGKVVLRFDEHERGVLAQRRDQAHLPVQADRTYLISGALGGFGLATARRLALRGARHLLLLGRGGAASPEAKEQVAALEVQGVAVRVLRADVSDFSALRAALDEGLKGWPALGGIVHAAAVLEDATIANLTPDSCARVLAAKAAGAWNLHCLSRDLPLDFFILYSSATTVLGNPGQGAYVAANAALETLAAQRRSLGLPALAVGWGPLSDVGMLAREPAALASLSTLLGAEALTSDQALDALEALHGCTPGRVAVANLDWGRARRLPMAASPVFGRMNQGQSAENGEAPAFSAESLRALPADEAKALLTELISAEAAHILRLPRARVSASAPLQSLGMDSLMALELGLAMEGHLGSEAPQLAVQGGSSIQDLAGRLHQALLEGQNNGQGNGQGNGDGNGHVQGQAKGQPGAAGVDRLLGQIQASHGFALGPQLAESVLRDVADDTGGKGSHE